MTSSNDITGDYLKSRPATESYRNNYDAIFRKAKQPEVALTQEQHAAMDEMAGIWNEEYKENDND